MSYHNFVDLAIIAKMESLWKLLKFKIVKKMCGTNEDLLERFLVKYLW